MFGKPLNTSCISEGDVMIPQSVGTKTNLSAFRETLRDTVTQIDNIHKTDQLMVPDMVTILSTHQIWLRTCKDSFDCKNNALAFSPVDRIN